MGQEIRETQVTVAMDPARVAPPKAQPQLRVVAGNVLAPDEPPAPKTSREVGRSLRAARRRRQLTLEQAADHTRIPRTALPALERGTPEGLPDPPYDRYFLREYARYLSLDEEPLLGSLAERAAEPRPILPEFPSEARPLRRWPMWTLAVGSLVVVVALGWGRLGSGGPDPLSNAGGAAPVPVQAPRPQAGPAVPPPKAPAPHGVSAVIHLNGTCWIEATVDGRVVLRETVTAGRTVRLHARRTLDLVLGSGGSATLRVNDGTVHTGAVGQVVRLSFVWKHGRLVAG